MDIKSLLIWISSHVDQVFGTTLVLFILTSMILLIRSINEKKREEGQALDVREIEGAMKRVLSTQTVSVAGAVGAEGAAASSASDKQAITERDAKILQLGQELEKAKVEVEQARAAGAGGAAGAPAGAGDGSAEDAKAIQDLKAKLEEAQAKLNEYEIIEDDIADLSAFKEENAKLKAEVEALRAANPGAAAAVPQSEPKAAAEPSKTAAPKAPPPTKPEGFQIDSSDDVMKQFATAIEVQKAPSPATVSLVATPPAAPEPAAADANSDPLAGATDTDKMLSEVASLQNPVEDNGSVLEETLDTDKLLEEAGSFGGVAEPPPQAAVAAPAAVPVAAPAPAASVPASAASADPSDDLLAEFMDSENKG